MKKKIEISATAKKTNSGFQGFVKFSNEKGVEIVFDYQYNDPDGEILNIKFSNRNKKEKFEIKGMPSAETAKKLSDREQHILSLAAEPIDKAVDRSPLTHMAAVIEETGTSEGDEVIMEIEVEKNIYDLLF
jgi:hypothetical protein